MVAPFVHAQRAHVHEPLDSCLAGGFEQQPERLDIEPAELGERAPVADLGRAVEDPVGPGDSGSQRSGDLPGRPTTVSTPHWSSHRVSLVGPYQSPDAMPSPQGFLGGMACRPVPLRP